MPFPDDERAVSQLIGALFVFAILIFSLVSYQAVIVPSQNKQVEFNHFEEVKDDFRDQRTALVNAGASGETRSASLNLGTRYPSRSIALNAAPASGTYETVQPGDGNIDTTNLDLANLCGLGSTVPVHHTVYRPDYNYLSVDSEQRYENTVYYQPTGGSSLLNRTEQIFIRPNGSGGTIDLYPLQDSFSRSGTRSTTVDFVGGDTGEITKSDGSYTSFTINVPSRISESQWDDTLLPNTNLNGGPDNVDLTVTGENAEFEFTGGNWEIQCHPVGIGEAPDQSSNLTPPDGSGGSSNPGPTKTNVSILPTSGQATGQGITFDMRNDGNTPANIDFISIDGTTTDARFVDNGANPTVELNTTGQTDANITIDAGPRAFTTQGQIPANSGAKFTIKKFLDPQPMGPDGVTMGGSIVKFTLYFADGSAETYAIELP